MLIHVMLTVLTWQCRLKFVSSALEHVSRNVQANNLSKADNDLERFEKLAGDTIQNFRLYKFLPTFPLKQLIENEVPKNVFKQNVELPTKLVVPYCSLCQIFATYVIVNVRSGFLTGLLREFSIFVCNVFSSFLDPIVCEKLILTNADIINYIILNKNDLTADEVCAIVLHNQGCFKDYLPNWKINIPPRRREIQRKRQAGPSTFQVIHISDLHMDPLYVEKSSADCGRPLCCQNDTPAFKNGAGFWGDYRDCDMPWYSLKATLDDLAEQHNNNPKHSFKYVYFTGDIISHRIWETSPISNEREIRRFYRMMRRTFGTLPVYPAIGNHESHPANVFTPPGISQFSVQWLFDALAEEWRMWLPSNAFDTVQKAGCYSVLAEPGFRIISINSNVCTGLNWWLLYDNKDPYDQLQWLAQELLQAEERDEVVHLLSHYPAGEDDCIRPWATEFRRVIERFSDTIVAEFNGHTHFDEFKLFYNTSNISQPIHVAYNGGSFTSFTHVNPNYKVYDINQASYEVADSSSWIYQIPVANFFPNVTPQWYKLYSFKSAYGLKTLSLKSLDRFVNKLAKSKWLSWMYYRYKMGDSEDAITQGCDIHCMRDNLCNIVTVVFNEDSKCHELLKHRMADDFSGVS